MNDGVNSFSKCISCSTGSVSPDKPLCFNCWTELSKNGEKGAKHTEEKKPSHKTPDSTKKTPINKSIKDEDRKDTESWIEGEYIVVTHKEPKTGLDTENDFRARFPATIRTEDGHMVRSRGEAMIDNWLYHKGIPHAYERKVPVSDELYCDFFIPIGTKCYIEYWGLEENEKYRKRKERKIEIYKANEKDLIEIYDKHIENLGDHLPGLLMKHLPKTFNFD